MQEIECSVYFYMKRVEYEYKYNVYDYIKLNKKIAKMITAFNLHSYTSANKLTCSLPLPQAKYVQSSMFEYSMYRVIMYLICCSGLALTMALVNVRGSHEARQTGELLDLLLQRGTRALRLCGRICRGAATGRVGRRGRRGRTLNARGHNDSRRRARGGRRRRRRRRREQAVEMLVVARALHFHAVLGVVAVGA